MSYSSSPTRKSWLQLAIAMATLAAGGSAWGQANIPRWSPYRPAPAPLAPAPQQPLQLGPLQAHEAPRPAEGRTWTLVRNRDTSGGKPPYALAGATGRLERYVESSPGIDLEQHLGQHVRVRHDMGETLLSSQLVLLGSRAAATGEIALADYQVGSPLRGERPSRGNTPPLINRAGSAAEQLVGEHDVVTDRGPLQSLFEWAGGERLNRFISVGHPREE